MVEHIVHEESNGTNALIAIFLILALLIVGFFLFRNGIPGTNPSTNINVKLPSTEGIKATQ